MHARDTTSSNGHIHYLSDQEARELFDARARYHLRISGDVFLERWLRGHYDERREDPDVMAVAMLLPLVDEDARK